MYRCDECHQVAGPHVSATRVTLETREVDYPARKRANCIARGGRTRFTDDPGGAGREIARQATLCPRCAATRSRT